MQKKQEFDLPNLTPPIPFKKKTGLIMAAFSNCEPVRTEYTETAYEVCSG